MWVSYAVAAALLILLMTTYEVAELAEFRLPMFIADWGTLRTDFLFVIIVSLGLYCGEFHKIGRAVALTVTSYCLAVISMATTVAWIEFVNRDRPESEPPVGSWSTIGAFFSRHDPTKVFGLGFWALMTPPAAVALLVLLWFLRRRLRVHVGIGQVLARIVLFSAAGAVAFILGSMLAETQSPSGSMISSSAIGFEPLPIIALGALTAWVILEHRQPATSAGEVGLSRRNISKIIASASQISVVALVLLFLAISQISAYGNRVARLVATREAFADDLIDLYSKTPDAFNSSSTAGGITIRSALVQDVGWGDVFVDHLPDKLDTYRIRVAEHLSHDTWSVRGWPVRATPGYIPGRTKSAAAQEGVKYDPTETPVQIFPRIETELRSREVAFPGVGISLGLGSFAIVVPVVIFATLVLLAYRVKLVLAAYSIPDEPWLLLDADSGMPGAIARMWIVALAGGPWLLSIFVVSVVALNLRARGASQSGWLDAVATGYAGVVVVMLIAAAASVAENLIELRARARQCSTTADSRQQGHFE